MVLHFIYCRISSVHAYVLPSNALNFVKCLQNGFSVVYSRSMLNLYDVFLYG